MRPVRIDPAAGEPVAAFERALQRLDNRVRHWSVSRWTGPAADGRQRADVAYELAVTLADLGRQAGSGAPAVAPQRLQPHGVTDQLALLGRELRNAPDAAAHAEAGTAAVERVLELL